MPRPNDATVEPLTAADVVRARRTFWQRYARRGSGFFDPTNNDAADDLFDALAEEGAFTTQWLKQQAAIAEKESY